MQVFHPSFWWRRYKRKLLLALISVCLSPTVAGAVTNPFVNITSTVLTVPHPKSTLMKQTALPTEPSKSSDLIPQPLKDEDLILVQFVYGTTVLGENIDAATINNRVCLDLEQVAKALDFPIKVDLETGVAEGWFIEEKKTFHLDQRRNVVTIEGKIRSVPAQALVITPNGLCVDTAALEDWFGLTLNFSLQSLAVSVTSSNTLPFLARLEREEQRKRLEEYKTRQKGKPLPQVQILPYAWWSTPSFEVQAQSTVQGYENRKTKITRRATITAMAELARMSTEWLFQTNNKGKPDILRARAFRRDPDGEVFGKKWGVTEIQVGDITAPGDELVSLSGTGRGASISTIPFTRPDEWNRTTIRGDLPAGWDAELYRNETLIDFVTANSGGRYEFVDVPVFYGLNEFKVVLRGPQGQKREETSRFNVGLQGIPKGKVYGGFSVLENGRNLIELYPNRRKRGASSYPLQLNSSLWAGLTDSIAWRSSVLADQQNSQTNWYFKNALTFANGTSAYELTNTVQNNGATANQITARTQIADYLVYGRYAVFLNQFQGSRVAPDQSMAWQVTASGNIDFSKDRRIPLSLGVMGLRYTDGYVPVTVQAQTGFRLGTINIGTGASFAWDREGFRTRGNLSTSYRVNDQASVRSALSYTIVPKPRLDLFSLTADYRTKSRNPWLYRVSADWSRVEDLGRLYGNISKVFDPLVLGMNGSVSTDGSFYAGVNLSFSVSPTGDGWALSSKKATELLTAKVAVFEDIDRNGELDAGDRPIPGARVSATSGKVRGVANDKGIVSVSSLPADAKVQFTLDDTTLGDTNLTPAYPALLVKTHLGNNAAVNFPVIYTGAIEGFVKFSKDDKLLRGDGFILNLIDLGGSVIASQVTAYDGFYAFDKVPLGDYIIGLSPEHAEKLHVKLPEVTQVSITREGPYASDVNLVVVDKDAPRIPPKERNPWPSSATRLTIASGPVGGLQPDPSGLKSPSPRLSVKENPWQKSTQLTLQSV